LALSSSSTEDEDEDEDSDEEKWLRFFFFFFFLGVSLFRGRSSTPVSGIFSDETDLLVTLFFISMYH
jgi:hypothetical protein